MKLVLEFQGIEFTLEEVEGKVVVKAEKDGEMIEEMEVSLNAEVEGDENQTETPTDELPIDDAPAAEEGEMSNEEPPMEEENDGIEESIMNFDDFCKK